MTTEVSQASVTWMGQGSRMTIYALDLRNTSQIKGRVHL